MKITYKLDSKDKDYLGNLINTSSDEYIKVWLDKKLESLKDNRFSSNHTYYRYTCAAIEFVYSIKDLLEYESLLDNAMKDKIKFEKSNPPVVYQKPEKKTKTTKAKTVKAKVDKVESKEPINKPFSIGFKLK